MEGSTSPSAGPRDPEYRASWIRAFYVVNKASQAIAGTTLIAIMLMAVINVVGRRFFNSPVSGTIELTEIGMVIVVYLSLAYAEDNRDHIVVDLVYSRLPGGLRRISSAVASLVTTCIAGLLVWQLFSFMLRMKGGGFATSILAIPMWYVAAAAGFGAVMFTVSAGINAYLTARGVSE